MSDDENDVHTPTPERIAALGFKPQKEIPINTLLPYADQLDEESVRLFQQIKTNFAKAVMLREMKPACGVWSARLMKYLRMYGLKFSKEDHIALIKLVYELIMIPDLEPSKVHKFSTLFVMLTKKRYLISPEELTLPWRPLYDLGKNLFDKSRTHIGMFHFLSPNRSAKGGPSMTDMIKRFLSGSGLDEALALFGWSQTNEDDSMSLESSYITMVKCAKPYFDLNATKEILDDMLPQISPWSTDPYLMHHLYVFLPVSLPPKHADKGHELWLNEFLTLWETCPNAQCGINEVIILFASLAKRNPGTVDWTPLVPKMFSRFLHTFNLPVSYKDMQYCRNQSLDTKNIASWIVWTIAPDGLVLKHLRTFLIGVESYLQSANSGRWSYKLKDFLRKLTKEFINRVRRESEKKFRKSWENQTPESYKLREEDITEFVNIVLEPALLAFHSRCGSVDSPAIQVLATLRPAIVIPPLIDRLRTSLESLTEPHRVTSAMAVVAAAARPLIRGPLRDYPEGPTHIVPLLMSTLPGLDPNDLKKTLITLHFILIFSMMITYIDCSSASQYWTDLTEEELLTCESTAQLEDFVLLYFDRIFAIVESSSLENARLETKESDSLKSKAESVIENALCAGSMVMLSNCSPKIFDEALRKFVKFATTTTFEMNVAGSIVGVLVRVFARVNPVACVAAFLPQLCSELNELLTDEALKEENPPRELVYRLHLLSHVLECNGTALLKYMPQITQVLDRALKLHSKEAIMRACEALGHIMISLSTVELLEFKGNNKDYSKAPQEWLPIREWGQGCLLKDAKFSWHIPIQEEVDCAQELFNRYAKPEIERLKQWISGERDMCRKRKLRCFYIINASIACNNFLPSPDEPAVELVETLVPATSFPLASGVNKKITFDGENVRVKLTKLFLDVQKKMVDEKSDDTRGFEMLIQVWERLSGVRAARAGSNIEIRMRSFAVLERVLDGKGGPVGGGRMRSLLADAVKLQDEARIDLQSEAGIGETGLSILNALFQLSVYTYTSVRILSQVRLYWMLSYYAYSYRALLPQITDLLAKGGEGDEWHAKHKGALCIILGPRTGPLVAKQDWDVAKKLWPAILKAPLSEKPSILKLEQAFSETLHRHFPAVNTSLEMTSSCVEAAKYFLTEEELKQPDFVKYLEKSLETERINSEKNVRVYNDLLEELVSIAETPNIQWRRLELVMQMLTYCPLLQTPYTPNTVRLIVNSLIHDDIAVRRIATRLTHFALKQRKTKVVKLKVSPYEIAGVPKPEKCIPGYREDNEWCLWDESSIPNTDEEWNKPWLRNSSYGFYGWTDEIEVAAPPSEQLPLDRDPSTMEEGERNIFEFFNNDENVNRLVAFYTVEEKKGKDKFSGYRFAMFRVLFRVFGARIANKFLAHAEKHATDSQEAPQRFAAEIAAAAIKSPRYWPREEALAQYEKAIRILKSGLSSLTAETMEDWGTCIATAVENMDPNRNAPIIKALLELCAPSPTDDEDADADQKSSFGVCARIYALQGVVGSLTWRAAPLAAELLDQLIAAKFIQHPYQNVRENMGGILMSIFDTEMVFPGGQPGPAPRFELFLKSVRPKLASLYNEHGEVVVKTAPPASTAPGCAVGSSWACCYGGVPLLAMHAVTLLVKTALSLSTASCSPRAPPPDAPSPALPRGDNLVAVHVAALCKEPRVQDDDQPRGDNEQETQEENLEIVERAEKTLATRLETALRIDGDDSSSGTKNQTRAVHLLTTVLRACMSITVRCVNTKTKAQYQLFKTACALSARGPPHPHDELARSADGFLASLAMAHHTPEVFQVAMNSLEEVAKSKSWWARYACVEFAQPLLFYGLPLLCDNPQLAVRAEKLALTLMLDHRLEVRQAAAKLLTGLMHCKALPDEDKTINIFMKYCRSKDIVERHCGVLGLCAYLSSRPYSLGPRIGVVLAELSKHTNAPDPVPSAIRTALADFKRTHQDDWPKHREALTNEELDLLADMTLPPSYCA